jgi:hypothetical protein
VHDGNFVAGAGEGGLQLQQAAWVSGGDDVGVERRDEFGFAVA